MSGKSSPKAFPSHDILKIESAAPPAEWWGSSRVSHCWRRHLSHFPLVAAIGNVQNYGASSTSNISDTVSGVMLSQTT